jgi:hypothetical protein
MNISPFYFVGDIDVSVGVQYTMDLWFATVHINVDIGAKLHLQGPPFGGYVYVDFWVFGFTIHFGNAGNAEAAIDLPAFWQLLLQQAETPGVHAISAVPFDLPSTVAPGIPQVDNAHVLVVQSGRALGSSKEQSIETKEGAPWIVRPQGFTFCVQSRFAVGTASCNGHNGIVSPAPIYAKPMHLQDDQAIDSTLKINVSFKEDLGVFTCTPVMKKVPKALWAACKFILLEFEFFFATKRAPDSADEDPQIHGNNIPNLLHSNDSATVDLVMGVSVTAPPPHNPADPIQPFDVLAAMSEDVFTEEDHYTPKLPSSLATSLTKWAPEPLVDTTDDPAAPWQAVQKAWANPVDAVEGYDLATAVTAWAETLGWFTTPVGKLPTQLVAGIEQYYMSAPFIGQVV